MLTPLADANMFVQPRVSSIPRSWGYCEHLTKRVPRPSTGIIYLNIDFLLSFFFTRGMYWMRENFQISVFTGFTQFKGERSLKNVFPKCLSASLCISVCDTNFAGSPFQDLIYGIQ